MQKIFITSAAEDIVTNHNVPGQHYGSHQLVCPQRQWVESELGAVIAILLVRHIGTLYDRVIACALIER